MMTADQFARDIRMATTHGVGSSLKGPGNTAKTAAALEAYEQSVAQGQAQAEQAAYLYRVLKNCREWMAMKAAKRGGNTDGRRAVIDLLRIQSAYTLRNQYPLVQQALDHYDGKKAQAFPNLGAQRTTSLAGVYAHEGKMFGDKKGKLKAQGQFHDPGQPRFAPSATNMHGNYGDEEKRKLGGKAFKDLTFDDYTKLDRLLGSQYQVLYMSKMQRLSYMVAVDTGLLVRATDSTAYDMPGTTVEADLGAGRFMANVKLYACDRYGNLFITGNDIRDAQGNYLQVNHSTFLSGNEVLCAGTISIKNGKLRGISNQSGHYQPDTAALTAMINFLKQEGVVVRGIVVSDMANQSTTEGEMYLAGRYNQFPLLGLKKAQMMAAVT